MLHCASASTITLLRFKLYLDLALLWQNPFNLTVDVLSFYVAPLMIFLLEKVDQVSQTGSLHLLMSY